MSVTGAKGYPPTNFLKVLVLQIATYCYNLLLR